MAAAKVSLAVAPGECLAVVGPSGAGKSTIAHSIVGLHPPRSGAVRLDRATVAGELRHRTAAQRRFVQLRPQAITTALNPRCTVGTSIARPVLRVGDRRRSETGGEVDRLLGHVSLPTEVAGRRPSTLSGGERQRVVIARALAVQPHVLVCDEITSGLDHAVQQEIVALLADLRAGPW